MSRFPRLCRWCLSILSKVLLLALIFVLGALATQPIPGDVFFQHYLRYLQH